MSSMDIDGIYKNAKLVASDTPYLKPLSDEQIVFYNLDVNTAILTFQVKKDKYPLQISSLNSDIDLYVESENGSHTSLTKVEYIDPINGIIRFVIDRDFLKASTDTWVNGQVRVKAVGRPDTVILNEFRFYVKDALINKIGADIKVKYIRQIDDLIEEAEKRLIAASAGIENVENIQLSFNSFISEQKQDLEKIVNLVDSPSNTLCICTGSLGSRVENDVAKIIGDFAKRGKIGAIHARNIKFTGEKQFYESAHLSKCGSLDMYAIMKALYDADFDGYLRPDHGRMIWGEEGRAGYGLYDRALGVAYLNGLWEAIDKNNK